MKYKLTKQAWEEAGKKAGWMKIAQEVEDYSDLSKVSPPSKEIFYEGPMVNDPNNPTHEKEDLVRSKQVEILVEKLIEMVKPVSKILADRFWVQYAGLDVGDKENEEYLYLLLDNVSDKLNELTRGKI